MSRVLKLTVGSSVYLGDLPCTVIKLKGLLRAVVRERSSGIDHDVRTDELKSYPASAGPPESGPSKTDPLVVDKNDKKRADERLKIITPLLGKRRTRAEVEARALEFKISVPTLYRYIRDYETGGYSALIPSKPGKDKGSRQLDQEVESAIKELIKERLKERRPYKENKLIQYVQDTLETRELKVPHKNTIRSRLHDLEESMTLEDASRRSAKGRRLPDRGKLPPPLCPLSVVQIDHTPLDVFVVDEVRRKSIGRAWLTVAIDIFSRMVLGFYLTLDPPSAISVGQCLRRAILRKESYLRSLNLSHYEWPCWGIMHAVSADNGKDFRSEFVTELADLRDFEIHWRPVRKPKWGAFIERLLGTVNAEVHSLAGTTKKHSDLLGEYKGQELANMTLGELERWLTIFFCGIYHLRDHKQIGCAPLDKYLEGIADIGLPDVLEEDHQVYCEFLPYVERTIQAYGVRLDHIDYDGPGLLAYKELTETSKRSKTKHIFKRDHRNIQYVYFLDPTLEKYVDISTKDPTWPPFSIWELRATIKKLRPEGKSALNERRIREAMQELRQVENDAAEKSMSARRRIASRPTEPKPDASLDQDSTGGASSTAPKDGGSKRASAPIPNYNWEDIKPYGADDE